MYDINNATVPVSQVRTFVRKIAQEGKFLNNVNGGWSFAARTPFIGLNTGMTYQTEDQALDAVLGIYFPELLKKAA